jgi:hypothetical protein
MPNRQKRLNMPAEMIARYPMAECDRILRGCPEGVNRLLVIAFDLGARPQAKHKAKAMAAKA